MKRKTIWSIVMFSCIVGAAVSICVITPIMLGGCTTVQNPDGSTSRVLGFETPEAQAQAKETVTAAASALPFPFNLIVKTVGDLAIIGIGVYAAKKKGEDIGWDAAHAESPVLGGTPAAKPPTPPSA